MQRREISVIVSDRAASGIHMTLLFHILIGVFATFLILIGIIAAVSPIPFGIVMISLGFIMLGIVAPPVRPLLKSLRRRWGWFDKQLDKAQETLPDPIADPLRESDPHDDGEDESRKS